MVEAGICARYSREASARILEKTGRFYNPCTRALSLGSIARGQEKNGRQAGRREWASGGREEGSGNEKKKKEEERPISSAVEFHERAIAADVRSAEELCGREIPRE